MISVLIVDDQALMREGLRAILSAEEDIHVIGTARNGEEALHLVETLSPQIVVMEVHMPGMNGIDCTKLIRSLYPKTIVLILTMLTEDEYIIDALAGGAVGYLLKDIHAERLAQSIRDAVSGDLLLPSVIGTKLATRLLFISNMVQELMASTRLKVRELKLSDKALEVTRLMMEGRTNREIASQLFMSEGTIKNHVSAIYAKIGTNNRTVAIMRLRELRKGI